MAWSPRSELGSSLNIDMHNSFSQQFLAMACGRPANEGPSVDDRTPLIRNVVGSRNQVPIRITRRLYTSHFLSTWNSRVFEFGAVLYLATVFPGTLLPMSVYALTRGLSAILFAPAIGHYVDTGNRLQVVRVSISKCSLPGSQGPFHAMSLISLQFSSALPWRHPASSFTCSSSGCHSDVAGERACWCSCPS